MSAVSDARRIYHERRPGALRVARRSAVCAFVAGIVATSLAARAAVEEHAYALRLYMSATSDTAITIVEGDGFDIDVAISAQHANPDGNDDNDYLDALAAFVVSDSASRGFEVMQVVWLPSESSPPEGLYWADFNNDDDPELNFDPPEPPAEPSVYPQMLTSQTPLRVVGMEYPQDDMVGLASNDIGENWVITRISLVAPSVTELIETFRLSFIGSGGQAPSASNNVGERQIAQAGGEGLTVIVVKPECITDTGGADDCNANGLHDNCDIQVCPDAENACQDCNENGRLDGCDVSSGVSEDCDNNLQPDACQSFEGQDCNENGVPDVCDIADGTSEDCQTDEGQTGYGIPDECEVSDDCNQNGVNDQCDIATGLSADCTGNDIPDECETDCNSNGVADTCDIVADPTLDCEGYGNGLIDTCEEDCNDNGVADTCDIAICPPGETWCTDCNHNGIPDGVPGLCEGPFEDRNQNDTIDICDIDEDPSLDCNGNWRLDEFELIDDPSLDCHLPEEPGYGQPDDCDLYGNDCNDNGLPDDCEIRLSPELDQDDNDVIDSCEDCQANGIPDRCDIDCGAPGCDYWDNCGERFDDNDNGVPDECEQAATDAVLTAGEAFHELYVTYLRTLEGGRLAFISGMDGNPTITGVASDAGGDYAYVLAHPNQPRITIYRVDLATGQAGALSIIYDRLCLPVAYHALALGGGTALETLYVGATSYPRSAITLLLIDATTGELRHETSLDTDGEELLDFAYDSRRDVLYALGDEGALLAWLVNPFTGAVAEYRAPVHISQAVDNLAYDRLRNRLLAIKDGRLYSVDPESGEVICAGGGFEGPASEAGLTYWQFAELPADGSPWYELPAGSARGGGVTRGCAGASEPGLAVDGTTGMAIVVYEDAGVVSLRRFELSHGDRLEAWRGVAGSVDPGISEDGASAPRVAMTGSEEETPVVAWSQSFSDPSASPNEIYVRRLDLDSDSWVEMGTGSASGRGISDTLATSRDPVIAVLPTGEPVIAWNEEQETFGFAQVYVRRWSSNYGDWIEMGGGSASGNGVSASQDAAMDVALALDEYGRPVLAWADRSTDTGADFDIYVIRWNGDQWEEVSPGSASVDGITGDSPFNDQQPALAFDGVGNLLVAWSSCRDPDCEMDRQVKVLRWDGGAWGPLGDSAGPLGVSQTPGLSVDPAVALGADGNVVVAWSDRSTSPAQILARQWNGAQWAEIGPGSGVGLGISGTLYSADARRPMLAVDHRGAIVIAWANDVAGAADQVFVRSYGGAPPTPPSCGNGYFNPDEECDDGNNDDVDGCSSTCAVEDGWECVGEPSECTEVCGDGLIVGGENCDPPDGQCCSESCTFEAPGTACDDGEECTEDDQCTDGACAGYRVYADICLPYDPPDAPQPDLDDILCVLDDFADGAAVDGCACDGFRNTTDLHPCPEDGGGDGEIALDDILLMLTDFAGQSPCDDPCPG